ncbi:MAG: MOSC domain-containing protein [Anaerovoracaceae bacterium]|jgi:MOSC domain-containing protein YiiM
MAEIVAVCISEKKGEQKHPVDEVKLRVDHGIVGDAHAGNWHRQVSLLGEESVDKMRAKIDIELPPGAFAENILTRGITLYTLPIGTRLKIGTAVGEVTQIGKECHYGCAIRRLTGDCVMPREGIFVKILKEGTAGAGDPIEILERGEEDESA